MIQLKRVYEKPAPTDGTRFLVERLWPRGVRKADLQMDAWQKEAGPSDQLRKWFAHDPKNGLSFRKGISPNLRHGPKLGIRFCWLRNVTRGLHCSTALMTPNTITLSH
jgi:uncharacterized protein YeaO (DUF488 family)